MPFEANSPALVVPRTPVRSDAHGYAKVRAALARPAVRWLLAIHALVLVGTAPLYPIVGLSIVWSSAASQALLLGLLLAVWVYYAQSGRSRKPVAADALLATFLLVLFTNIVGTAQYAGVALGFPLVDPYLAAADRAIGVDVPALTEWTAQYPWLRFAFVLSYFSLLPQFVFALLALGLFYNDRAGLWEYAFHFHFCLTVTLLGVTLLPAECAFTYYGFTSLIDQTRFINHFEGLRAGTLTELRIGDIEGLISFPSFHVAGGMMVTWAFRRRPAPFAILAVLNVLLIAATIFTGAHYGIDVIATAMLFALSVVLWRALSRGRPVQA